MVQKWVRPKKRRDSGGFRVRAATNTSMPLTDASQASLSDHGFRSRTNTGFSVGGVATSISSIHQRVKTTVTGSMASIRDGYRYSRRTGSSYAIADLPKTKPTADFGMMLGSLSSMRHLKKEP